MSFICLTRDSDGEKVYINANLITAVYPYYGKENVAVVSLAGDCEGLDVKESVDDVIRLIGMVLNETS